MSRCDHGFETDVVPCPDGCPGAATAPPPLGRARVFSDTQIRAALEAERSVNAAARRLGISRGGLFKRARQTPELAALLQQKTMPTNWSTKFRHGGFVDMTGQVVHGPHGSTFTVVREAPKSENGNAQWACLHSCGGSEVILEGIRLRSSPPRYCEHCRPKKPGTVQRRTT